LSKGKAFDQEFLEPFLKLRPRSSSIFLTAASNIDEAVEAAIRFHGPEDVTLPRADENSHIWMIVFFGWGSSAPPRWEVESIEQSPSKLVVRFSKPAAVVRTTDFVPYFVLAPLKDLQAGTYQLELRNSATNELSLMRTVKLIAPNK